MSEGVHRVAVVVRCIAVAWAIGVMLLAGSLDMWASAEPAGIVAILLVVALPAALAWALAWIIDGFA